MVLATENPIEYEGTYPLPEAQLDRFLMKLTVGYPSAADEEGLLRLRHSGVARRRWTTSGPWATPDVPGRARTRSTP